MDVAFRIACAILAVKTVKVYALYARSDQRVRYVGQTTFDVAYRVRKHVERAIRNTAKPTHREAWIRKVIRSGDQVHVCVLSGNAEWNIDEIAWIRRLRTAGVDLVNATAGGEGCLDAPAELRQKIADSVSTLWADPGYRARQSSAHKGKPWSAERRAACDAVSAEVRSDRAKRGRATLSPERRSAISSQAALAGRAKRRLARGG